MLHRLFFSMGNAMLKMRMFILALVFGCFLTTGCGPGVDVKMAQPYKVLKTEDFSLSGRKRTRVFIWSSASTVLERAHTVVKAAINEQKKSESQVVEIWLEPSKIIVGRGCALANALYAPDSKGLSGSEKWEWDVRVSKHIVRSLNLKMEELWWANKDDYQRNGRTDEPELKEFIASQLQCPIDSVSRLDVVLTEEYSVK